MLEEAPQETGTSRASDREAISSASEVGVEQKKAASGGFSSRRTHRQLIHHPSGRRMESHARGCHRNAKAALPSSPCRRTPSSNARWPLNAAEPSVRAALKNMSQGLLHVRLGAPACLFVNNQYPERTAFTELTQPGTTCRAASWAAQGRGGPLRAKRRLCGRLIFDHRRTNVPVTRIIPRLASGPP